MYIYIMDCLRGQRSRSGCFPSIVSMFLADKTKARQTVRVSAP